jgi:hypothetical protein
MHVALAGLEKLLPQEPPTKLGRVTILLSLNSSQIFTLTLIYITCYKKMYVTGMRNMTFVSINTSPLNYTLLGIPASKDMYPTTSHNKRFKTNIFRLKFTIYVVVYFHNFPEYLENMLSLHFR